MSSYFTLEVGKKVPDFALFDQHHQLFSLGGEREREVLLSFHPLAWTKICARQMQSLEEHLARFDELKTLPLGISVDSVPCKHAWAKELGVKKLRLLSDFWPHGQVARQLGLFREEDGFSQRANILLDEEKRVVWFKIYEIKELPPVEEIIDFLERLGS